MIQGNPELSASRSQSPTLFLYSMSFICIILASPRLADQIVNNARLPSFLFSYDVKDRSTLFHKLSRIRKAITSNIPMPIIGKQKYFYSIWLSIVLLFLMCEISLSLKDNKYYFPLRLLTVIPFYYTPFF